MISLHARTAYKMKLIIAEIRELYECVNYLSQEIKKKLNWVHVFGYFMDRKMKKKKRKKRIKFRELVFATTFSLGTVAE